MPAFPTDSTPYGELWDECNQLRQSIANAVTPWNVKPVLSAKERDDAWVQQYREQEGDPNDPAYAAEMDRLLHFWDTGEILPAEPT